MAEQQEQLPCPDYKSYLSEPDESCKDFIMQQTMMRIKDPKRSLDFYTRVLGMRSASVNALSHLCLPSDAHIFWCMSSVNSLITSYLILWVEHFIL